MNIELGREAVRAARLAAEAETQGKAENPKFSNGFEEPTGVFVTISQYPSGDLRGCIGYPEPVLPLGQAIVSAARSACHDSRFSPLTLKEAEKCVFEVTILTHPKKIKFSSSEDLLKNIEIGRDGLILSYMGRRGLLLPQVPVEWGWDKEEYLSHLSVKAGLSQDTWKKEGVVIENFQGKIFAEESPKGEVIRK
ncbi:MAG TPA: TIGR00296 family protein [Candidatus Methanomethylophilaceae archaeon]|nr:TIGR00296 family protein [Candidatus Methanomethylophilaceae archaeon]